MKITTIPAIITTTTIIATTTIFITSTKNHFQSNHLKLMTNFPLTTPPCTRENTVAPGEMLVKGGNSFKGLRRFWRVEKILEG